MEALIYITWFLALCTTFSSFFFDNKKYILVIQACTILLLATHMLLLWALWWAWFLFIQVARNIFFSFTKNIVYLHIGLWILIIVYTLIYFKSIHYDAYALLPYAATILWTLWCYVRNTTWVRLFFLASTVPFTFYMVIEDLIFPLITQIVLISSILINITRFDIIPYFKNKTLKTN